MSLITTQNLGKSYDPVDIFSGLNLSIPPNARIAIVGPNGVGKTTLLRVLAGFENPSHGEVHKAKNLTIGFLPQESVLESDLTLWDECMQPFEYLQEKEQELVQLTDEIANSNHNQEVIDRYGKLEEWFEHQGGYTYQTRVRQVLTGLGFNEYEFQMPLAHLSGGQRTRALLARLLLENPQLLILDEPTNHLDISAVEWLEGYLRDWEGAALIVSHDRYFLDRTCDHIWEMSGGRIEIYRGNYSHYLEQRQERWELRSKIFESEKEKLEKDLHYIKRNIAGQNVLQAKGRLKRLSRTIQAIEQVGIEAVVGKKWGELSADVETTTSVMGVEEAQRRLRALKNPIVRPHNISINLDARKRSGKLVLRTYDVLIGYPGTPLFRAPDIVLHRLECAALIGPNGAGKSTFLKTILEQIPPLEGEVRLGASLDVGYFAQAHEDLDPQRTLVQEIDSVAPWMLEADIRSYLARFLFRGDEVYKKVSVLSGGERGRMALAKLALSNSNLLLLDEPTNHLDIPSQEILQDVISNFNGTVILVSHDRYLINALATQIWEIDKNEQELSVFEGNYTQYREQRERELAEKKAASAGSNGNDQRADRRARNRQIAEERRRTARLEQVEERIHELESNLAELSRKLADPEITPQVVKKLGQEYVKFQDELDLLMEEWGVLHRQ